jgi:hypothetical protein
MLKSHDHMWTRLSQLQKDIPLWVAGRLTGRASAATGATTGAPTSATNGARSRSSTHAPADTAQNATASELGDTGQTCQLAQFDALQEVDPDTASIAESLLIPICGACPETDSRHALQDKGQFLARQERWSELSQLIRKADQQRNCTPGGLPAADLLAYGARADVINAVEHALADRSTKPGAGGENRILIDGVMALETLRCEHRQDSILTTIVALAHIDVAWIWRSTAPQVAPSKASTEPHLRRARAHFERAAALLEPLKDQSKDSAFLSAAQCALFAGQTANTLKVADAYGALIDKDPGNPRPMRALGVQMLPRTNGSYAALELEARRTAIRTRKEWGAGGYTWVYFDAMALDEQACDRVDATFFLEGLQDILRTNPSQEMVNLLAAYCAVSLRNGPGGGDTAQTAQADQTSQARRKISEAARWLIRGHLRELHPLIWAHACEGFDNNARIASLQRFAAHGQAAALRCIAGIFRDEIDSGHKIAFTPEGIDLVSG